MAPHISERIVDYSG